MILLTYTSSNKQSVLPIYNILKHNYNRNISIYSGMKTQAITCTVVSSQLFYIHCLPLLSNNVILSSMQTIFPSMIAILSVLALFSALSLSTIPVVLSSCVFISSYWISISESFWLTTWKVQFQVVAQCLRPNVSSMGKHSHYEIGITIQRRMSQHGQIQIF